MTKPETAMTLVLRKRGGGWIASVGEVNDLQAWHADERYTDDVEGGLSSDWEEHIISDGKKMRHIVYDTPYKALVAALKRLPGGKCEECKGEGWMHQLVSTSKNGIETWKNYPCPTCAALFAAVRREGGAGMSRHRQLLLARSMKALREGIAVAVGVAISIMLPVGFFIVFCTFSDGCLETLIRIFGE